MGRVTNFLKLFLPAENDVYNEEKDQNENFEKIDAKLKEINEGFLPRGNSEGSYPKTAYDLDKDLKDIKDNRWRLYSKKLANGTDLNTVQELGRYYSNSSNNDFPNKPANGDTAFILIVESATPEVTNKYLVQTFKNFTNNNVFRRVMVDYVWKDWEKISDNLGEYEPKISTKYSGFNLEKTDTPENNTNKLLTAKGGYDLQNTFDSEFWKIDTHSLHTSKGIYHDGMGVYVGSNNELNFSSMLENLVVNYRPSKGGSKINRISFHAGDGANSYAEIVAGNIISNGEKVANVRGNYDIQQIGGAYSGDGGKQPPSYVSPGKVRFLMSSEEVNGDINYKDWLYMDTYAGRDVGFVTAFGVRKSGSNPVQAYIMRSNREGTAWAEKAELYTTNNLIRKVWSGSYGSDGVVCTLPSDWKIVFVQGAWHSRYPAAVTTEILFRGDGLEAYSPGAEINFSVNTSNQIYWSRSNTTSEDAVCRAVYVMTGVSL